jgi:hypothetical protein
MKPIDWEQAGEAEAFGALAVSRHKRHRRVRSANSSFTPGQVRVLCELADSIVQIAKEAGANHKIVKFGDISLKLHEEGVDEVLSIRKAGR